MISLALHCVWRVWNCACRSSKSVSVVPGQPVDIVVTGGQDQLDSLEKTGRKVSNFGCGIPPGNTLGLIEVLTRRGLYGHLTFCLCEAPYFNGNVAVWCDAHCEGID